MRPRRKVFGYWLVAETGEHGTPFNKLCLHLLLDFERVIGYSLGTATSELRLQSQDVASELEVLR
jgi:hypothetical protein